MFCGLLTCITSAAGSGGGGGPGVGGTGRSGLRAVCSSPSSCDAVCQKRRLIVIPGRMNRSQNCRCTMFPPSTISYSPWIMRRSIYGAPVASQMLSSISFESVSTSKGHVSIHTTYSPCCTTLYGKPIAHSSCVHKLEALGVAAGRGWRNIAITRPEATAPCS